MAIKLGDMILGYGLIGHRCDIRDITTGKTFCENQADSILRHRATGAVVSARCRKHDTPTRRMELENGNCPTCLLSRSWHHDEIENTYSCETAISYAIAAVER